MAKVFDQKAVIGTPSKNVFNLSYRNRLSAIMGQLIPVLHKEVIPGDRWRVSMDSLIRLAPLKAPVFDGVHADFHAFFVPNRILDPKWKEFITDGNSLDVGSVVFDEDTRPSPLYFLANDYYNVVGSAQENFGFHISGLFDYLNLHVCTYDTDGAPDFPDTVLDGDVRLNALPILGYHKIWSDWYRNERLESGFALGGDGFTSLVFKTSDDRVIEALRYSGSESLDSDQFSALHKRNYKKDRYTTALPEPCIGGPVMIPGAGASGQINVTDGTGKDVLVGSLSSADDQYGIVGSPTADLTTSSNLMVQLADAATATIQELKTAFKMYSFFMKDTYNGNRYVEFMESHYNVRVPDATVDRAIFLGRARVDIRFGEVFQTSGQTVEGENSLGDYAGRGVGAGSSFLFDDTFYEHGQLYVIMSIVPNQTYFQGIDPKFLKKDRFDYFFPEFQNIGDVAINTRELYFNGTLAGDSVFGYQSRWYEYKAFTDEIHGDFLPNNQGEGSNMSFWNMARYMENSPLLSAKFVNVTPRNAPFVQISEWSDNYLIDIQWNIKALRPIMYYESF